MIRILWKWVLIYAVLLAIYNYAHAEFVYNVPPPERIKYLKIINQPKSFRFTDPIIPKQFRGKNEAQYRIFKMAQSRRYTDYIITFNNIADDKAVVMFCSRALAENAWLKKSVWRVCGIY